MYAVELFRRYCRRQLRPFQWWSVGADLFTSTDLFSEECSYHQYHRRECLQLDGPFPTDTCTGCIRIFTLQSGAVLDVHLWLIEHLPSLCIELCGGQTIITSGPSFGSRCVVPPTKGRVYRCITAKPEPMFGRVRIKTIGQAVFLLDPAS
jgi:hypothetical protein